MDKEDFRRRQLADFARYTDVDGDYVIRRRPFHERLEALTGANNDQADNDDTKAEESDEDDSHSTPNVLNDDADNNGAGGEEAWRNKEGERLADFGVDEVAEFYDEGDSVPRPS